MIWLKGSILEICIINMAIVLSKSLNLNQSIKLTPSLKKSIDLLQLSRFELIKKIENEIIENPFLEKTENNIDSSDLSGFDFDIESKLTLRETLIKQLDEFHLDKRKMELSQLLIDIDRVREFEKLQDIVDAEIEKKRES